MRFSIFRHFDPQNMTHAGAVAGLHLVRSGLYSVCFSHRSSVGRNARFSGVCTKTINQQRPFRRTFSDFESWSWSRSRSYSLLHHNARCAAAAGYLRASYEAPSSLYLGPLPLPPVSLSHISQTANTANNPPTTKTPHLSVNLFLFFLHAFIMLYAGRRPSISQTAQVVVRR